MAKCAIIDLETNEQVNFVLVDPNALAPDGCKYVEIPDGYYWDQATAQLVSINNGN